MLAEINDSLWSHCPGRVYSTCSTVAGFVLVFERKSQKSR